jgi:hypothetical protein
LTREQAHLLEFVIDRPTTFPSTRESQLDLARRVDQIPRMLDKSVELGRDLPYHSKRLELLQEIQELRSKATGANDAAQANKNKLDADESLLAATDAEHAAQVRVDQLKAQRPTTAP